MAEPLELFSSPVDKIRFESYIERSKMPLQSSDIWYLHTVLTQCFLPYKDPKTDRWYRANGEFSLSIVAGDVRNRRGNMKSVGLPYGPKPRLFQSYVCMKAIKLQSPIVPVERSMSDMMHTLGLAVTGGEFGTINVFKNQIIRFSAAHITLVGPGPKGSVSHVKTTPIRRFDVFFPNDPRQASLWPSEIHLTTDYYLSLKDHAVPFDFRALKPIQAKPRAQDIYLWMTQRLCRIDRRKPLFLRWKELCEMFGGELTLKDFRKVFPRDLLAARMSYTSANIEDTKEGYIFRHSLPPVPKIMVAVK